MAAMREGQDLRTERSDDAAALRELFAEHFDAVTGYAMRRASPADAADVVAETMLVAWRRIGDVPAPPATRAWLFGVARRVLANQRRGAVRRLALSQRLAFDLEAMRATRQPDHATATAHNDRARRALDALGDDDREVLLLSAWEGLSPAEIAVAFDIPPATARTRLHRARTRLRAELDDADRRERGPTSGHFIADGHNAVQALQEGDR